MDTVKLEPSDNNVFVMLDSDELRFSYRTRTSIPNLIYIDVNKKNSIRCK